MAITITGKQGAALYGEVLTRFGGIDVVYKAAVAGELEKAQERGQEFSDLLLLVLTDLRWGIPTSSETIELTTPPAVLRRALIGLLGSAAEQLALDEQDLADRRTEMKDVQFVADTCIDVLKDLGDGPA